ncbi:MAG: hypothetical protein LBD31_03470 [Treponema sp.]|nr:hypothetical protein [Treponema sp.]
MKFKAVILFFNALMVFFLGLVFFLPFAVLGKEMALVFWGSGWFLLPLLLGALLVVDVFFALNYRVYVLLEKEDWPALVQELEEQVFHRGRRAPRLIRLLANTYLVLSDAKSVTILEQKLAMIRGSLINGNALVFGAARILAKDYRGAVEFFSVRLPGGTARRSLRVSDAAWIRWYHGFALLLARRFEAAADEFILLARESGDAVLTGLSAYFLADTLAKFLALRSGELLKEGDTGRERVRRSLKTRFHWNRELKRIETEVYAAVLSSYMAKAADFIYGT